MLIRKFNFCFVEVKCLLRTFCYSLYMSSFWTKFRVSDLKRLEVCYNTIFRILAGLNRWESPRSTFIHTNVLSSQKNLRSKMYNIRYRFFFISDNSMIALMISSDVLSMSSLVDMLLPHTGKMFMFGLFIFVHICLYGLC